MQDQYNDSADKIHCRIDVTKDIYSLSLNIGHFTIIGGLARLYFTRLSNYCGMICTTRDNLTLYVTQFLIQ